MGFAKLQGVGWSDHLGRLLFLTYGLFLAGFFYVPNAVDLYKFYSVAVFIPGLLWLPRAYPLLRSNHLFYLVLIYLAYMLVTPAWGESFQWKPYLNYLRLALYVLVFLATSVLLHWVWPRQFELMLRCIGILAGLSAVVSLVLWFRSDPTTYERISGIGILVNPNPSGYVHATLAMLNLAYAFRSTDKPWWRIGHVLAVAVLSYFVLMTHSRGALLSLVFAVAAFFTFKRPRNLVYFIIIVLAVVILVKSYFPELYAAIDRNVGLRPYIWEDILDRVSQAPLFGLGYLTEQFMPVPGVTSKHVFAHNAYLATLRDGGAVGVLLMLIMLGYSCWQAYRIGREKGDFTCLALLVLALVCMCFDTDRLLNRPKVLWLVLWFPIALIISNTLAFCHEEKDDVAANPMSSRVEEW